MLKKSGIGSYKGWGIALLLIGMVGCSTHQLPQHPQDPYENFNRKVFAFNLTVDRVVLRPVAKVYDAVLPWPVQRGVRNFFGNLRDLTAAANIGLQLQPGRMVAGLARVAINTILGLGGLFDVATSLGLEKDKADFGLTLGVWGAKASPYLVLPFLGPFTLRDAVGVPVDYLFFSVWPHLESDRLYYGLQITSIVQNRAVLLAGDELIEQAFDPYIFVRDAYLQRRNYLVGVAREQFSEKYVDDRGVAHRRHGGIPAESVIAN